ncbi:hypothetical protein [Rhizorhabdus sp. FW153]|uniref:hypothetical protein n=1 Tax=Rhizorhabdus sp. FW153 TaxID=3400216 RepID=UPI003CE80691
MARELKEHELASPVDLSATPIEGDHPVLWTATIIAVAALILLFANAGTLSAWVDEKPVTELQLQASEAAGVWKERMDAIGLTAPRDALHRVWKDAQAIRFGDEAPEGTR